MGGTGRATPAPTGADGPKRVLGAGTVPALIVLPILQIMVGTVGNMTLAEGSTARGLAGMIGSSPIALLTAVITAAGLLAQPILDAGYNPTQMTLVTLAIAFGGLGLSHINDSGFWIVPKYLGLSVKDGLKTWTVLSTVLGVVGFLITWGVFALVS